MGLNFKTTLWKRHTPFLVIANSDAYTIGKALENWDVKYYSISKLKREIGEKILKVI